jgi:hypothetical protein
MYDINAYKMWLFFTQYIIVLHSCVELTKKKKKTRTL